MQVKNECGKCGGRGHIKGYEHIAGGVCFQCDGTGYAGGFRALKVRASKTMAKLPGCNARQTAEILNDGGGAAWRLDRACTIESLEKTFGHYLRSGLWDLQDYQVVCLDETRLSALRIEALKAQGDIKPPTGFFL